MTQIVHKIWLGRKPESSLTVPFVAGMFQRLEKMKKNAFASCCLFGKDNDSTISGTRLGTPAEFKKIRIGTPKKIRIPSCKLQFYGF